MAALTKLGPMNKELDPRGRYDAVMATDGLLFSPRRKVESVNWDVAA